MFSSHFMEVVITFVFFFLFFEGEEDKFRGKKKYRAQRDRKLNLTIVKHRSGKGISGGWSNRSLTVNDYEFRVK